MTYSGRLRVKVKSSRSSKIFFERYPGTALELGCGSGRLLTPLLGKGYLLEGLDNSARYAATCAERALPAFEPVLHQAGIENFHTGSPLRRHHHPPPSLFSSFILSCYRLRSPNIHQHLHPGGGGLYLSYFYPLGRNHRRASRRRSWYSRPRSGNP